ncbi:tRNA (adenosine(37)-N6)-dimethylallyltransferase MiaA [Dongia sp.]|uniref:tRNA (adenosine(37)-N6)-dimethylallyltransferase MiaA n=1 Tax=Dongia sp. TaxID=1977262 RepID=UPI0034A427AB
MTVGRIEERAVEDKTQQPAGRVIVIAGPTASGKSALALDLAKALGGTIINADSMQVYRDLPILTAQPDDADLGRVPHRLYGFLDLDDACDAQRWAGLAAAEIATVIEAGGVPIVVGGTGLYLRALTTGFSPLPEIADAARHAARTMVAEQGAPAIHELLLARDPASAARIKPTDRQRIARAWEVLIATDRPLSWWQSQAPVAPTTHRFLTLVLNPDRAALYQAVEGRFRTMLDRGVLAEVAAAEQLPGQAVAGGRKALGYPELAAVVQGSMELETAIPAAQQATRRYAKRQLTWFRHQIADANFISPDLPAMKFSQSYTAETRHKIRNFLLTP